MKIKKNDLQILVREIICETLQVLQESQRGEWWIYPGGDSQFADGNVGDSGHEGFVISHVAHEIYEHFCGSAPDEMGYLSDHEDDILRSLMDDDRMTPEEISNWNNESNGGGPFDVLVKKLLEDKIYKDQEQTDFAVSIAYGFSSRDARDYAMKYLGWVRMTTGGSQTYLQTWLLRPEDMESMRRGVFDAWGDYDEDETDAEHTVNIEVRANDRYFSDIPLEEFGRATVRDIVQYMKRSFQMKEKVAPVMNPVNFT